MLVVVNQPHTDNFRIEGNISPSFMDVLRKEFGNNLQVDDEEWIYVEDTDWYKTPKASRTPAANLKFYRTRKRMTQKSLGEVLGIEKQYVSDMEHGRKEISKMMAKRLADYFNVSVSRFI